ncbi:MAG: efflux RND transporter periplasmic adaptor subunit [Burkholderiales bacterium]|nr:efflux RND transporter periplasmic adaptor subunit [Burkholderiales bacterium]
MTSHPSSVRGPLAIGAFVVALALFAFWTFEGPAHADKPAHAPPPPVPIVSAPVQQRDMPIYASGVGTVAALQTVTVRARIDGQLERVAYTEGQDVKAGQLLAEIDPRSYQAQLAQARAQRAKDAALLGGARGDLARYTTLVAQDAATRQQLDNQRALVDQLTAAVQADDAAIQLAQVQLGYTRITAPISGRVGARLVDAGNIVHASDAGGLVVINQIDPIAVVFTLPDTVFPSVQRATRDAHAPLAVLAYPREKNGGEPLARGQLILVNNQIDTASGTLQLKGRFANAGHALWPGQYLNVRLLLGHDAQALVVPQAAVQRGQEGTYTYVVGDDKTVRSQAIEVSSVQDGLAVVAKGLAVGQRVVVDGQYKLKPGSAIVESQAASAAASKTAS